MPDDQSLSTDPAAIGSNLEAQAAQEAKAEGQVATIEGGIATPWTWPLHGRLMRATPLLPIDSLVRMLLKPASSLHSVPETEMRNVAHVKDSTRRRVLVGPGWIAGAAVYIVNSIPVNPME
jgi:hypothetical protein